MTGFFTWFAVMVMWLASVVFGVVIASAAVTYVRRTWQLIRADEDGSAQERIMDGFDRLDTRLEALSRRLAQLEEQSGLPRPGSTHEPTRLPTLSQDDPSRLAAESRDDESVA
jgi:hypothetical protein